MVFLETLFADMDAPLLYEQIMVLSLKTRLPYFYIILALTIQEPIQIAHVQTAKPNDLFKPL